jgi:hypothetical protein
MTFAAETSKNQFIQMYLGNIPYNYNLVSIPNTNTNEDTICWFNTKGNGSYQGL